MAIYYVQYASSQAPDRWYTIARVDPQDAQLEVDLHRTTELVDRGCPPETAKRIPL